uniref:phasin family protein n=1 Tax=uncultured Sphingomonas sp. TaxID=158754 RepID=UPI0025FA5573|nr:TIGR01841 family phasin [uncultured Sphingomonas sp.]
MNEHEQQANHVEAMEPEVMEAVKKVNARRVRTERKPQPSTVEPSQVDLSSSDQAQDDQDFATAAADAESAPAATQNEKEPTMNYDAANWMNSFAQVPGADRLQTMFTEAGERGQQLAERSQKATGELVELTRANVEALVESGRIAAAGAQTLGQDAIARTREGLEQTVAQVKSLTQAQSPTEFFQLQAEIARSQFDRTVADGSRFAESMVKLVGEAVQPLSNRAVVNAEKLNNLTA